MTYKYQPGFKYSRLTGLLLATFFWPSQVLPQQNLAQQGLAQQNPVQQGLSEQSWSALDWPEQIWSEQAAREMSCTLSVLDDLGWELANHSETVGVENPHACESDSSPVFRYNSFTEDPENLLSRSQDLLHSDTSKCLFNRSYHSSVKSAVTKLSDNTEFKFLPVGDDPRDPFLPPGNSWEPRDGRGYDIPAQNISSAIQSLYHEPFVAECSTAIQIAQLAALNEHFGATTDQMINKNEVGIGHWKGYKKIPSISAGKTLFVDPSDRRADGLRKLAETGRTAFYGQIGYIKPVEGLDHIDSLDNRGQNYMIVDITDEAVDAIKARKKPLKELSRISKQMWKKYEKRLSKGESKESLKEEMQAELEATDPFFSEIQIYVHPLRTKNFAEHLARQFGWNPRTPYIFEVYEDLQPGYFYSRYIDHQVNQCMQADYCRRVDRRKYQWTNAKGIPDDTLYPTHSSCLAAAN